MEVCGRRTWLQITACVSALPLLILANFYFYVLRARIDLGHWPKFGDRYPRLIHKDFEFLATALSLVFGPYVVLVAILLAVLGRWRHSDFPVWKLSGLAVVTSAFLVIVCRIDSGGFLNWFFD